jgi:uncharacterized C2H2 Zn-finger protein
LPQKKTSIGATAGVDRTITYLKLLHCPDCDKLLRPQPDSSDGLPRFHCSRCHQSLGWMTRGARRVVLKVVGNRHERPDTGKRMISRWR